MVTKVGNLRVYCNGKIFVGPDWKSLCATFLLIFIPSILFLSMVATEMEEGILWIGFLLIIFNLFMLGFTGLSNPGIIPRRPTPSGPNARSIPATRTKEFKINGYTISTKYCTTCHIYRVPRCSHCSFTDNCVEKFDHYCPWVGTCIGRRNYRFFLMFVFSGTLLCLFVCVASLCRLIEISDNHNDEFDVALRREPVAIILVIYTFAAAWFVGGLSAFHTYLVLTNQTTYEHIRRRFNQHGNPYNKGIFMNLFEACCQQNPPYDWESDSQLHPSQDSSRNIGLPAGVVLNPTIIAMQQEAIRAGREQRPSGAKVPDIGSGGHGLRGFNNRPLSVNEYPESFYSSSSSVDIRRAGMTMQRLPPHYMSVRHQQETTPEETEVVPDEIQERDEHSSSLSVSVDRRTPSRQSLTDSVSRRPSFRGLPTGGRGSLRKIGNTDRRLQGHSSSIRGDSANLSIYPYPELEMSSVQSNSGHPFDSNVEDSGYADASQVDVATALSSVTSNATSEVSSHLTVRSDFPTRKHSRQQRHRRPYNQCLLITDKSIPDLYIGRKHSARGDLGGDVALDLKENAHLCSPDGIGRLRSLRVSGEHMLNHLRAKIKKHSKSKEFPVQTADVDVTDTVSIDIESQLHDDHEAETKATIGLQHPSDGPKTWVSQLSPLTQQKYTELRESSPSPSEEHSTDDIQQQDSRSVPSASSTNNIIQGNSADSQATTEPDPVRISRPDCDNDAETLL